MQIKQLFIPTLFAEGIKFTSKWQGKNILPHNAHKAHRKT
jgi:hypothetical protein